MVMLRAFRLRSISTAGLNRRRKQRGYMMITLLLALALITIGLLAMVPAIKQQIQRDREEELRHRGTAYMRAIQRFYRRLGRYPTRLEELENTNNMRFIRKLYKDPMTRDRATGKEKDFKLLHQMDISLNNGPVLGQTPGQSGLPGQGGPQGQGGPGGFGAQPGGPQQTGDLQTPSSGGFGSSSSGNPSDAGGDSNSPGSSSSDSNSGSGLNGPTFGGGPILGVASTSKEKTIRVFYDKNHYNDWLFIYVQGMDRGRQLMGPVNPSLPSANLETPPGQSTPSAGQTQVVPQPQQNPAQAVPQQ